MLTVPGSRWASGRISPPAVSNRRSTDRAYRPAPAGLFRHRASGGQPVIWTAMANVPEKPTLDGIEQRWGEQWEADGTYHFRPGTGRDAVFAIDTPPPT